MTWLRLDAMTFQDRAVRRAGRAGRLAFVAAMTMTKAHGWVSGPGREFCDVRGFLPAKDFNAEEVALWFGEVGDDAVAFYGAGISACIAEGLIVPVGGGFVIPNWRKFQPDPSNAARQADFRDRTREEGRNRYAKAKRGQPRRDTPTTKGVTGRNVSNDDVTGRDVTGRDEVNVPVTTFVRSSGERPADGTGPPLGGVPAAASPAEVPNGSGPKHVAEILSGLSRPERVAKSAEAFEKSRAATLAYLAECERNAPCPTNTSTPTKTPLDVETPSGSVRSTPTAAPEGNST